MSASDGWKPLQVVEGKDQGLLDKAVDQKVVLGGINIGRLVTMSDDEVQRGGSDIADRVLDRIPPPKVAMVSRRGRIVQARSAKARGGFKSRALPVAVQVLWWCSGIVLRYCRGPYGWPRSDGQTGQRGATFQKAPAAGFFRLHEFLLWNTFPRFNKGGGQCQRNGASGRCGGIN